MHDILVTVNEEVLTMEELSRVNREILSELEKGKRNLYINLWAVRKTKFRLNIPVLEGLAIATHRNRQSVKLLINPSAHGLLTSSTFITNLGDIQVVQDIHEWEAIAPTQTQ